MALLATDKTTFHLLQLDDQLLPYSATVGSLPASVKEGEAKGEIHYTAYMREGNGRPLTFVFNGGPGSSSVWLHMGAFGPRRIVTPEEGQSATPPYELCDNGETLLDLTDLVFVDPIGTGLSRADSSETAQEFYDSFGDVHSIGDFIRDFLTVNRRWNSPLYLAGESYGTFRCCGLSDYLQSEHGIYPKGLILISCAIDFQTFLFDNDNFLPYSLYLPTYAATAWYHGRCRPDATLEEVVEEARKFAFDSYAPASWRPSRLSIKDRDTLYNQLAQLTGLPLNIIKREQGRIEEDTFLLEFFPDEKKVLGIYDTRVTGYYKNRQTHFGLDPSITSIAGIFSGAFHHYMASELDFPVSYLLFSTDINLRWEFKSYAPFGYPNFMDALRNSFIANPDLKVFVGMGYFDAATPFATAEYSFDHLNLPEGSIHSVQKEYYEGGHMYYLNPSARKKFKQDLIRFYQGELPCSGS